ncbi:YrzI family small protein [Anaerobacillus sp. CMMVII]|uniref:YrzI family small protein n=1 Tax=Anaerobacillus sp. CMMVII TaxID=2755588 RepID=UPI0021B74CC6|nr:YrzI family small protein [Anaerobacillus sp. CMMVII]MCT8137538.1 YrzI family small protein [Anaerobacillus sp. CMMVII]
MLINLFFFSVTISKRQYSNEEISKAYRMNKVESHIETVKAKSFDQQFKCL